MYPDWRSRSSSAALFCPFFSKNETEELAILLRLLYNKNILLEKERNMLNWKKGIAVVLAGL